MRVIAGKFRSRSLKSLKGLALRPTSDRLRETLFNVLADRVRDARFVDAFAGTGAVGIEALSRGAREVIFIENHVPAVALIRKNLQTLGIQSLASVVALDALRGLQRLAPNPPTASSVVDIVFLDPPYAAAQEYRRVLTFLGIAPFLGEGSLVIAEHRSSVELPEAFGGLARVRVLRQGDATLSFYRFTSNNLQTAPES
ncbi:MAG TPA: 16S rRNA (guanine(966)-N(2))-methyltransferase RsmD [Candidatus Acidoferrum sp.]|jgi:16S rRNA (guanine(966)-N(2))-methyltransferase RsmD